MLDYTAIREGLEVRDRDDDKIGTVGRVHVPTGVTGTTSTGMPSMSSQGVLKVDTGFLGLGKDLYIPFSSIRETRTDCVCLNVDKDDLDRMGWDEPPTWLR